MTVAELIEALKQMPQHAEVRCAMDTVYFADESGEIDICIEQTSEAQRVEQVKHEGHFVGVYA